MSKAEIQRALDAAPVRAELESIDPERVIYEESGWRVKDIIAHIATWDAETVRSLHAHRRGGAYTIPNYTDYNDFNAYAASIRMDEPIEQIWADLEATRRWMVIIFSAMTPDEFAAEMTYPAGDKGTVANLFDEILEHQELHLADIRAKVND